MGFLSNALSKVTGKSSKYGWLTGGEFPYAENRVGSFLNNVTGSTDMYNREYEGNVALWNMQNEYNTPAAQIARMKAAGIDINPMTYAVGNGSMSSSASNISTPSVGASGINPLATLMSVLSGIQGIKNAETGRQFVESQIVEHKLNNEMLRKDLEFYLKNGYRPGEDSWATLLPVLFSFFGSHKTKGIDLNPSDPKNPKIYNENDLVTHKGKPIIKRGRMLRVKDLVA